MVGQARWVTGNHPGNKGRSRTLLQGTSRAGSKDKVIKVLQTLSSQERQLLTASQKVAITL